MKRATDIAGSLALLSLSAPVLLGAGTLSTVVHGWPPVFEQRRLGHRGREFTLYKLRTMTDERDETGELLPDAMRLTRIGRWLRRTSIDELPELFNVLIGDMSLVGPRPLLVRYRDRYDEEQFHRHDAPPGLTGLAQVSGRNDLSWEEKFSLDVWYVKNWSLGLDAKILLDTVRAVVGGTGISAQGEATMGEFMGRTATRSES